MNNKFLLEIITEDMPASLQLHAEECVKNLYQEKLKELNISFNELNVYHTPRRLIVYVSGLPFTAIEEGVEKKGPAEDANENAIQGFLRSCGDYKEHEIIKKEIKGKLYYFFKQDSKEASMQDKMVDLTLNVLSSVKFKRSMFWNETKTLWARPIRSLCAMFNEDFLNFSFAGVTSCNHTFGHMFLQNNKVIHFNSIEQYFKELEKNDVMYDQNQRIDYIIQGYNKIAEKRGFLKLNQKGNNENSLRVINLIKNEVAFLVEYPFLLELDYSTSYLKELPADLIVETIEKNQKYLATFAEQSNKLVNTFIIVSNNLSSINYIVEGNLKVVDARLKDALFFYKDDIEKEPNYFYDKLQHIDFFKKLGSYQDKTKRELMVLESLIEELKPNFSFEQIKEDLQYLKIDIASATVQELPDFQGTFSKYYLPLKGVEYSRAVAISTQYKPAGNEDALPQEGLPAFVALAVKLETLLGFFAIGKNTSGSGDVLGLRRNALGALRIILDYKLNINLSKVFKAYSNKCELSTQEQNYQSLLQSFISQRIYYYLRQNYNHYLIKASFAYLENNEDNFNILTGYNNLLILEKLEQEGKITKLVAIYKRLYNISKSLNSVTDHKIDENILQTNYEVDFAKLVESIKGENNKLNMLNNLYEKADICNNFFDNVVVNDSNVNIKQNRQKMVQLLVGKLQEVANFHEIV